MKKVALTLILVAVVAAGVFAGVTAVQGATPPTISLSPSSGPAGTNVNVQGDNWPAGATVQIYIDSKTDNNQLLAVTANNGGHLTGGFTMTATTLGSHTIYAVVGTAEAQATFTLTSTNPLDKRTDSILSGISNEVNKIEGKLDDSSTGLAAIKNEASAIEGKLDNSSTGLAAIKNEASGIKTKLDDPITGLATLQRMDVEQDSVLDQSLNCVNGITKEVCVHNYTTVRHVSLTVSAQGNYDNYFGISVKVGDSQTWRELAKVDVDDDPGSCCRVMHWEFDAKEWHIFYHLDPACDCTCVQGVCKGDSLPCLLTTTDRGASLMQIDWTISSFYR